MTNPKTEYSRCEKEAREPFDPVVQKNYDTFIKERIKHYDWLDEYYSVLNDDEEYYPEIIKMYEKREIIDGFDDKGEIITSIIGTVEYPFCICLRNLGLPDDKIRYYVNILKEKYTRNGRCDILKFYYSLIFKNLTVNIYIMEDDIRIKTMYEYDTKQQMQPVFFRQTVIVLSLNSLLTFQFEEDFINTKETKYYLSQSERDVIEEVRTKDFQKDEVTVKLKQGKIDMIKTMGKEDDLTKLKELSEKYPDSFIGFQQYKGKKKHLKIETRKKY